MPAIRSNSDPIWPKKRPAPGGTPQQQINAILALLREPLPAPNDFLVVDQDGKPVVRLGAWQEGDLRVRGLWSNEAYFGGDDASTAPLWCDTGGRLVIGKNGYIELRDLDNTVRGLIGSLVEGTKNVVFAANNGTGQIRLTIIGHGWVSKDSITVANVGGVPNATGDWLITVIDANTVDLVGSTYAGAYTFGGTAYRTFSGMLTEQIALGPSLTDYRLRVFEDGSLTMRNATFQLEDGIYTFTIDATNFIDITWGVTGDTGETQLGPNELTFDRNLGGIQYRTVLDRQQLYFLYGTHVATYDYRGLSMYDGTIYLGMINGPRLDLGPDCYISMELGVEAAYLPPIYTTAYYVGASAGIDKTITHLSAAPTTITINYKDHAGADQTAIVCAPVTTTTTTATKGIVTT